MSTQSTELPKTARKVKGLGIKKSVKKPAAAFDLDVLSGKSPITSEEIKSNAEEAIKSLPEGHNYKTQFVDSNCITPDPDQPRKDITEESISSLCNRIETIGQLYPILVRNHPESESEFKYMIADGERRWRAIQKSTTINDISIILIPDTLTPADILIYQLSANNDREGMTVADKADAYRKISIMFKEEGKTQEAAAERIGISRTLLSKYTRICDEEYESIMHLSISDTCNDIEALYLLSTLKTLSEDVYSESLAMIQDDIVKGSVRAFVKSQIDKANKVSDDSPKKTIKTKMTRLKAESISYSSDKKSIQISVKGKVIEIDLSDIPEEIEKYFK